ncbi:hypothetical protein T484DRAFT_1815347, partial [Baffinella frigidus]
VALEPRDLATRERLASELFDRSRHHEALKHAEEALHLRPRGASQAVAVARIQQALGETFEAWKGYNSTVWQLSQAAAFKGVVRGDRDALRTQVSLTGQALAFAGRGENLTGQAQAFAGLGEVSSELHGDDNEAIAWVSRAIGVHGFDAASHKALARLLLRRRGYV